MRKKTPNPYNSKIKWKQKTAEGGRAKEAMDWIEGPRVFFFLGVRYIMKQNEVCNAALGHEVVLHI